VHRPESDSRCRQLKILAITSYGAHGPLTGGRLRRDNLLEALAQRGHDVDRVDVEARRPGVRSAVASAGLSLRAHLRRRAGAADVILLGDVFCLPMMPVLRRVGPPVVVDVVDSPYRLVGSAPRHTAGERVSVAVQAAQLLPVMQVLLPMADGVAYGSEDDLAVDRSRVRRLPEATVVPNGINAALFDVPRGAPPHDGYLAWLADWNYAPNRESYVWFVDEVAPRLADRVLSRIRTFGPGTPPQGRDGAWARAGGLIVHAGFVDPLSAVYDGARGVVAPVARGAGLANKVIEPLAAGRPVVTTPVGARGLPRAVQQHLRVASSGESFAAAMTAVLDHPLDEAAADAGREAVSLLTWSAAGEAMDGALHAALGRRG